MLGNVLFFADEEADIDQFIRDYLLDAIERIHAAEFCAGLSFDRDEQFAPEGASVAVVVMSDFEAFVEHERDRWERYRDAGVITDWETQSLSRDEAAQQYGEGGVELAQRLWPVAGRMGKLAYEAFDDGLPPAVSEERAGVGRADAGLGWWLVPHHITVGNLGYSPREELRMLRAILREDLHLIAERDGAAAAADEIEQLRDALADLRSEIDREQE